MGAPILLGGLEFRVLPDSLGSIRAEARGIAILTEISVTLRAGGYQPTKPKRGKPDDVRLRCLHRLGYLDLILIIAEATDQGSTFRMESWGFTKHHNNPVYEEFRAVWKNMAQLITHVIRDQYCASAIRTLTPAEVDAKYAGRGQAIGGRRSSLPNRTARTSETGDC